jgi:Protein of unknown function, DUF547
VKKLSATAPIVVMLLGVFLAIGSVSLSHAAPVSQLISSHWLTNNSESQQIVDHGALDLFLKSYRFVGEDGIARVRYDQVSDADQQKLEDYLTDLQQVTVTALNKDEQFAYWVNLYNTATLKLILQYYPVVSIKDISISPGFFSVGPWGKEFLTVEGQKLSLDTIEHGILRPIWQEARIHYMVNCASLGCPDIPAKAASSTNIDDQLTQAAISFINHPRGARVTDSGNLRLSSIYDWFSDDFGADDTAIIDHIRQYATGNIKTQLQSVTEIDGYGYSWDLNGGKADGAGS